MWRSHDDATWPARAHRSWSVPSASTDSWRERWKPPSNATPSSELDGLQTGQRSQRKASLACAPSFPKEPAFVPWAALGPGFRREVRAPSITAAMLEACLAPRFTTVACFARAVWTDGRMVDAGGTIVIEDGCDDDLGASMHDGLILIKGKLGKRVGNAMRGGLIVVHGDVDHDPGAAC